jgi:hypothetical protein
MRRGICCLFAVLGIAFLMPTLSPAAMMNYGDFGAATVDFLDVTEDNLEPNLLYQINGTVGDILLIDPDQFGAQKDPGPGADFIDSELEMVIMAKPGESVDQISFSEEGDYTIVGSGNVAASVAFFWQITEVDGTPIAPVSGSGSADFSASTPMAGGLWDIDFTVDLNDSLADAGMSGTITKAIFRFDNSLTSTAADANSIAFIKKKQIGGVRVMVPEPSGVVTLLVGLMGLLGYRRR